MGRDNLQRFTLTWFVSVCLTVAPDTPFYKTMSITCHIKTILP